MKNYLVVWTIDIDADSPEEAAQVARDIQLDPKSTAMVFGVSHSEVVRKAMFKLQHRFVRVDLDDDEEA